MFQGPCFVVDHLGAQAHAAKSWLFEDLELDDDQRSAIGLDMEWVADSKDTDNPVALVQTATENRCVLWRLCRTHTWDGHFEVPHALVDILDDPYIVKAGCGGRHDLRKLRDLHGIKVENYVDVQRLYGPVGNGHNYPGLSTMTENLLGFRVQDLGEAMGLPKHRWWQAHEGWEDPTLTEEQKRYAATDAWACLQLWKRLANN